MSILEPFLVKKWTKLFFFQNSMTEDWL